jgi:hypothetical protein
VLRKRNRARDVRLLPQLLRRLERHLDGRPEARSPDHIFSALRRGRAGQYQALTVGGIYQVVKDAVGLCPRDEARLPASPAPIARRYETHSAIDYGWRINGGIAQHYAHLTKDDAYEAMARALARR